MASAAFIEPLGVTILVEDHETLMAAAERHGYYWPTVCRGEADCGTCAVLLEEGQEHVCPLDTRERQTLESGRWAETPAPVWPASCV